MTSWASVLIRRGAAQVHQRITFWNRITTWPFLFCIRIEHFEGACTGQNFRNFKRPKNGEDGSVFDDFWTKRIAAMSAKFWKKFGPLKKLPRGRKIRKKFAKSLKNFGPYTVFGTKQNRNVHLSRPIPNSTNQWVESTASCKPCAASWAARLRAEP